VWISGHGGCPFLGLNSEIANPACVASNTALLDWLKDFPPGTVIIPNAVVNMYSYVGLESQDQIVFPKEGRHVESDLAESLSGLVNQLQSFGNNVILVNPVLSFNFEETYWPVEGCGILSLAFNVCRIQVRRILIDKQQEVVSDVLDTIATQTGAEILDLNEEFCNELICDLDHFPLGKFRPCNNERVPVDSYVSACEWGSLQSLPEGIRLRGA